MPDSSDREAVAEVDDLWYLSFVDPDIAATVPEDEQQPGGPSWLGAGEPGDSRSSGETVLAVPRDASRVGFRRHSTTPRTGRGAGADPLCENGWPASGRHPDRAATAR